MEVRRGDGIGIGRVLTIAGVVLLLGILPVGGLGGGQLIRVGLHLQVAPGRGATQLLFVALTLGQRARARGRGEGHFPVGIRQGLGQQTAVQGVQANEAIVLGVTGKGVGRH